MSKSYYSLLPFKTEQRERERGETRDELKNIDACITINIHKRLKKFLPLRSSFAQNKLKEIKTRGRNELSYMLMNHV